MTESQNLHVDVIKPGPLSHMRNLEQIGKCMPKLQQLPVFWRKALFRRHATVRSFSENSPFE